MAKVTLNLSEVLALMDPPESALQSVDSLRRYIKATLESNASHRAPGRPMVAFHPCYSDSDYRKIKAAILQVIRLDPDNYLSNEGERAKGFHLEQPNHPDQFRLDNNVVVELMSSVDPLDLTLPEVTINIPPGVISR